MSPLSQRVCTEFDLDGKERDGRNGVFSGRFNMEAPRRFLFGRLLLPFSGGFHVECKPLLKLRASVIKT